MANPQMQQDIWKDYDVAYRKMNVVMEKLNKNSARHLTGKYGLSENFHKLVKTEDDAMMLCDRAMQTLAEEYTVLINNFREETDPLKALGFLEEAEAIWRAETSVIGSFDIDGGEKEFFLNMRKHMLSILEEKLYEAGKAVSHNASDENITLCIVVLGMQDHIWGELGVPDEDPKRQNLRRLAYNFK